MVESFGLCSDVTVDTDKASWRDVPVLILLLTQQHHSSSQRLLPLIHLTSIFEQEAIRPMPLTIHTRNSMMGADKNFCRSETLHSLRLLEEILPIGPEECEVVIDKHAEHHPQGRDEHLLKCKSSSLCQMKHPTGDPNMPEDVWPAKKVWRMVGNKADLGTSKEKFDLVSVKCKNQRDKKKNSDESSVPVSEGSKCKSDNVDANANKKKKVDVEG